MMKRKILVAVTGASGSIYADLLLQKLQLIGDQWEELSLVMTTNAKEVWKIELGNESYIDHQVKHYATDDFNAPFASGSGQYETMIIIPCSMGTLGRIASGISNDLISRAADVILKERRKLICVARDTPYSLIHIRNMETIMLAGGIICPATPSFYSRPATIEALAATVVDRVIDLAGKTHCSMQWVQYFFLRLCVSAAKFAYLRSTNSIPG
jgi:flavin prenyltransferase